MISLLSACAVAPASSTATKRGVRSPTSVCSGSDVGRGETLRGEDIARAVPNNVRVAFLGEVHVEDARKVRDRLITSRAVAAEDVEAELARRFAAPSAVDIRYAYGDALATLREEKAFTHLALELPAKLLKPCLESIRSHYETRKKYPGFAEVSEQSIRDYEHRISTLPQSVCPFLHDFDNKYRPGILRLVEKAFEAGLDVVAVDAEMHETDEGSIACGLVEDATGQPRVQVRDRVMYREMERILARNKQAKILYWGGGWHSLDLYIDESDARPFVDALVEGDAAQAKVARQALIATLAEQGAARSISGSAQDDPFEPYMEGETLLVDHLAQCAVAAQRYGQSSTDIGFLGAMLRRAGYSTFSWYIHGFASSPFDESIRQYQRFPSNKNNWDAHGHICR